MKILTLITLIIVNLYAGEIISSTDNIADTQTRIADATKQDYINELTGTNHIKWFFWMTKSGRVFIADTRSGENADTTTIWEHSLTNFTWTPVSGGSVEKIFNSISLSGDGRTITLSTSSATSFVSGKTIVIDPNDRTTMIFNKNGNYTESGSSYSCSGKWVYISTNTVAITCENSGTALIPSSSSLTYVFTSETVTSGMNVSIYEKGINNSITSTTTVISTD